MFSELQLLATTRDFTPCPLLLHPVHLFAAPITPQDSLDITAALARWEEDDEKWLEGDWREYLQDGAEETTPEIEAEVAEQMLSIRRTVRFALHMLYHHGWTDEMARNSYRMSRVSDAEANHEFFDAMHLLHVHHEGKAPVSLVAQVGALGENLQDTRVTVEQVCLEEEEDDDEALPLVVRYGDTRVPMSFDNVDGQSMFRGFVDGLSVRVPLDHVVNMGVLLFASETGDRLPTAQRCQHRYRNSLPPNTKRHHETHSTRDVRRKC